MRLKVVACLVFLSSALYAMDEAKIIYEQHCIACHYNGVAGAPKWQDKKDWSPRLGGRTPDDLLVSVMKGLRAMPVKGTCMECSEEDIKAVILYMLPKS